MSQTLILFPARAPIGYVVLKSRDPRTGQESVTRLPVEISKELFRALDSLVQRVGGMSADVSLINDYPDILAPFAPISDVAPTLAGETIVQPGPTGGFAEGISMVTMPQIQSMIREAVAIEMSLMTQRQHPEPLASEMTFMPGVA